MPWLRGHNGLAKVKWSKFKVNVRSLHNGHLQTEDANIPHLLQGKLSFFSLKFGTYIFAIVLNSCMKHQTGPCQTGLLGTKPWVAKPRPVVQYHHVRSLLFWDLTQCTVFNSFLTFWDNLSSHLQGSRNPKTDDCTTEVNWNNLPFWDFVFHLIFYRGTKFQKTSCVSV